MSESSDAPPGKAPPGEAAVFPIREVGRLTGVNPVTLRAWERRYGLLRPRRTPKGHRLYSGRDIERVRRIVRLIDRGIPVGQIREVLDGPSGARRGDPVRAFGSEFQQLREDLLAGAGRCTAAALDRTLGRALALLPLDVFYRRVAEPVREELRARCERGELPMAARAMLDSKLEQRLASLLSVRGEGKGESGPLVWLFGLPREGERIAILVYALACAETGLQPVAITAPMQVAGLAAAALEGGVAALILVARSGLMDAQTRAGFGAVAGDTGLPCFAVVSAGPPDEEGLAGAGFEDLPAAPAAAAAFVSERVRSGPAADTDERTRRSA